MKLNFPCICTFLCALGLSASSQATYYNSLAWTQQLSSDQAKIAVDGAGNTFVVYRTPVNSGGTNISYTKFDIAGNPVVNHFLFYRASNSVELEQLLLSPAGTPQYLYVAANEDRGSNTLGVVETKSDLAGNQVWQANNNIASDQFTYVGGTVDSGDEFHLAMKKVASGYSYLEMQDMDPSGNVLLDNVNSNIAPDDAVWLRGLWSAVGRDETSQSSPSDSDRWGVYDPSDGHLVTGAVIDHADNGTYRYGYGYLHQYVDPAGAVDLVDSVTVYKDSNNMLVATKHFVRRYNLTGSLQWISASYDGSIPFINSYGSNNVIYLQSDGNLGSLFTEQYSHSGARNWAVPPSQPYINFGLLSDAGGAFYSYRDSSDDRQVDFVRIDPSGNTIWSGHDTSLFGNVSTTSKVVDQKNINGYFTAAIQVPANAGSAVDIQRYVPGITLSSVSTTSQQFRGGTSFPVRVQLNAPAPAGGMLVKITSSSTKAQFPNNSTAYNVTIPAGSLYALVKVHTSVVTTYTACVLTGVQNGVVRSDTLTLTT